MATFDFTIDDQSVGSVIGPQNGYIVALAMTTRPSAYEVPSFNHGRWTSGFFTLRQSGGSWRRDVYSFSPTSCTPYGDSSHRMLINANIGYVGALEVTSVPKGAVFSITISDQPNPRAMAA
jgi:hypothetical protein